MPALKTEDVLELATHKAEEVVLHPIITVAQQPTKADYVGLRKVKVEGFWKNHVPYRISYTIQADKLGGVQITLSVIPFLGLYDYNSVSLTTRLPLQGDKSSWKEDVLTATKYLLRLLAKEVKLTQAPPKNPTHAELVAWTAEKTRQDSEFVEERFLKWGLEAKK